MRRTDKKSSGYFEFCERLCCKNTYACEDTDFFRLFTFISNKRAVDALIFENTFRKFQNSCKYILFLLRHSHWFTSFLKIFFWADWYKNRRSFHIYFLMFDLLYLNFEKPSRAFFFQVVHRIMWTTPTCRNSMYVARSNTFYMVNIESSPLLSPVNPFYYLLPRCRSKAAVTVSIIEPPGWSCASCNGLILTCYGRIDGAQTTNGKAFIRATAHKARQVYFVIVVHSY